MWSCTQVSFYLLLCFYRKRIFENAKQSFVNSEVGLDDGFIALGSLIGFDNAQKM